MRIGVNTRLLLSSKMEGLGWYTYDVLKRLVEQHPEHQFVFFFDRKYDSKFIFGSNVEPVVIGPQARHPILFKIWFNWSITKALKKYKCDIFLSPDGYLSLKTDIPQIPVIHDLNWEHYPKDVPANVLKYYRNYFPKFAKKAAKIITVSHYSKQDIVKCYGIDPGKIEVHWNGASDEFIPLDTSEIEVVRNRYTNRKPYFLYVGALHPRKNLARLISGFASFASENKEIDLVIVGKNLWSEKMSGIPEISDEVKSRIVFTGYVSLDELTGITAAAYALTYVPYFEGFGIPLVEAMKCGVPVLSGNLTSLPEVGSDAVLYADPFSVEDIADKMNQLATDKKLYESLSKKGLERAKQFSWENTAGGVWDVIVQIYEKNNEG